MSGESWVAIGLGTLDRWLKALSIGEDADDVLFGEDPAGDLAALVGQIG